MVLMYETCRKGSRRGAQSELLPKYEQFLLFCFLKWQHPHCQVSFRSDTPSPENSHLVVCSPQRATHTSIRLHAKTQHQSGEYKQQNRRQEWKQNWHLVKCLYWSPTSIFKFICCIQSYFLGNVKNLLSLLFQKYFKGNLSELPLESDNII